MRFGVNYTPSCDWFHTWLNPDWKSIDKDFRQISSLGLDHVRIFPIWSYLQPNRTWLNHKALDDLRTMVHIAGEYGLDAYVDVLQGHLSSFDFLPSWLVTWHRGNMFVDAAAIQAECDLIQAINSTLEGEVAFKGLTLGNEVNQLSDDPHPTKMPATSAQISMWLDTLLASMRRTGQVSLCSVNDGTWFIDKHPFTPVQMANKGDMTVVHSWVFNGIAQGYGAASQECTSYSLYLAELAQAFRSDRNRMVWLQEIGAPENVLETEEIPNFCARSIRAALDCENMWGITWWCSHDVPQSMSDFPEFEHLLGIFNEQGKVKPAGRILSEFAKDYASSSHSIVAKPKNVAVVVPVGEDGNPLRRSSCAPGGSICDLWMKAQVQGLRPTIITSAVAQNAQALAELGVDTLLTEDHSYPGRFYTAVSDPSIAENC